MLDNALDIGIKEHEFWEMTIAELDRALDSFRRMEKAKLKERASMDYVLAQLIAVSLSKSINGGSDFPAIEEVYPSLFVDRAQNRQELNEQLSILRFKQFAEQHNKKFEQREVKTQSEC